MGSSQLLISLDRASGVPLQQQVCDQIARSVRTGTLRPGDPVPPSRELAVQLGVSRTVVMRAYELLRANGVLSSQRGSGTRVSRFGGGAASPVSRTPRRISPLPPRRTTDLDPLWQPWEPPPAQLPGDLIDFRHGTPALVDFPVARWRQSVNDALGRADAASLGYGPAEGSPVLRQEIAALLRRSRALAAAPEDIVVTSGSTQAMDICVRAMLGPGDVVVIEDPSHTVLRQIFGCAPAAVVPVPVDSEGLRVEEIEARVRAYGHDPDRVRMIYVTPSHQFPTGFVMSVRRRQALLGFARQRRAIILEDDYHNEFTFGSQRLAALAADPGGVDVVYTGSFSKTLFPSLRIGYAVLPPRVAGPFLGIKWITDRLTSTVNQEALADFITSGAYGRHIASMDRLYRRRRARLLDALAEHFGAGFRVSGEAAGLHMLVTLTATGLDEGEIGRRAALAGVRMYPAAGYFVHDPPADPTFLMGYAATPSARIADGVARLATRIR